MATENNSTQTGSMMYTTTFLIIKVDHSAKVSGKAVVVNGKICNLIRT